MATLERNVWEAVGKGTHRTGRGLVARLGNGQGEPMVPGSGSAAAPLPLQCRAGTAPANPPLLSLTQTERVSDRLAWGLGPLLADLGPDPPPSFLPFGSLVVGSLPRHPPKSHIWQKNSRSRAARSGNWSEV